MDLTLFKVARGFHGRSRFLDSAVFFLADTLTYLLALGMIAFILVAADSLTGRVMAAGQMFLAFILARGVFTTIIQYLVRRPRPFERLNFTPPFKPMSKWSMPSAHVGTLFAMSLVIFAFIPVWGVLYFILSFIVGAARVFAGVHWPSDVIVGILVGLASGMLVLKFFTAPSLFLF